MKTALLALALLVAPVPVLAEELVRAQILADVSAVEPGKTFTVGVKLTMSPHWHVYWINPGDTGIATKIKLTLPDGFSADDVQYPVPSKFIVPGGIVAIGYADEVMFLVPVTAPKDLKVGTEVTIGARASWLVCNEDQCVTGNKSVEWKTTASDKSIEANREEFVKWRAQIPQPMDGVTQKVQVDAPGGDFKSATGTITMNWPEKAEKVEWFAATPDQVAVSSYDVKTEGNQSIVTFKVDALRGEKIADASFPSVIAYTFGGKRAGALVPVKLSSKGS